MTRFSDLKEIALLFENEAFSYGARLNRKSKLVVSLLNNGIEIRSIEYANDRGKTSKCRKTHVRAKTTFVLYARFAHMRTSEI